MIDENYFLSFFSIHRHLLLLFSHFVLFRWITVQSGDNQHKRNTHTRLIVRWLYFYFQFFIIWIVLFCNETSRDLKSLILPSIEDHLHTLQLLAGEETYKIHGDITNHFNHWMKKMMKLSYCFAILLRISITFSINIVFSYSSERFNSCFRRKKNYHCFTRERERERKALDEHAKEVMHTAVVALVSA